MAAICGVLVNWYMGNQTCVAAHLTDAEGPAFYTAFQMNKYLSLVDEWLLLPFKKATIIYEDNQPLIDILNAGQITGRVKYMAVPLAICHREIKLRHCELKKLSGILNESDLGTKPLPALLFHRLLQWC